VSIAMITVLLEVWMIIEAIQVFPRAKGIIEQNAIQPVGASAAFSETLAGNAEGGRS